MFYVTIQKRIIFIFNTNNVFFLKLIDSNVPKFLFMKYRSYFICSISKNKTNNNFNFDAFNKKKSFS